MTKVNEGAIKVELGWNRCGKAGELMNRTIGVDKYVGYEVYDLLKDEERTIGELKAVDNRIALLDCIDKNNSCGEETDLLIIATSFEVSKSKLYIVYENIG